jgi:hypothetical protein
LIMLPQHLINNKTKLFRLNNQIQIQHKITKNGSKLDQK